MTIDSAALRRIIRRVLLTSLPLLPACGPSYGEATYVVRKDAGETCLAACMTLKGHMLDMYTTVGDVMNCVDGQSSDALLLDGGVDASVDVAVCRMRTTSNGGGAGRAPAGLVALQRSSNDEGGLLAEMAHLEAASVFAFRRLTRELLAHGAPRRLVDAARVAARDEVRHARVVGRWRDRFGGAPLEVRIEGSLEVRPLSAVAQENALEGCVQETWSAISTAAQAAACPDPALARDLEGIAIDEASHAALAWQIDAWARRELGAAAAASLDAARAERAAQLFDGVDAELAALGDAGRALGLPTRAQARRMIGAAHQELPWSA